MTTTAERHAVEAERRSICAIRAVGARHRERIDRLQRRHGALTEDQLCDLRVLEDLDHDLLTGRSIWAALYGLEAR